MISSENATNFEITTVNWQRDQDEALWRPRRTFNRTKARTSKPGPKEMKYPLHAKAVDTLDLDKATHLMSDSTLKRFNEVYYHILKPDIPRDVFSQEAISVNNSLSRDDIKVLTDTGIIEHLSHESLHSQPTKAYVKPFTTVEVRDSGPRRRFICWPEAHNAALKGVYHADVPIEQSSSYLPKLETSGAVKRDLRCGFCQIPLPKLSRPYYRFIFEDKVYQMTRVPMGHMCAPEVQQILTSVLAGQPEYVDEPYSCSGNCDIQGGKSDAAGGLKIAKPFQFWKMILFIRDLLLVFESSRRVLCFRKGSFPGYRGVFN